MPECLAIHTEFCELHFMGLCLLVYYWGCSHIFTAFMDYDYESFFFGYGCGSCLSLVFWLRDIYEYTIINAL